MLCSFGCSTQGPVGPESGSVTAGKGDSFVRAGLLSVFLRNVEMMYCVNCENPVTYDDKAARKCPHCGNDPAHEAPKAAIAVRPDVITEANRAIAEVRDIVTQLNTYEREYLQKTSPTYRQLVETIRNWK